MPSSVVNSDPGAITDPADWTDPRRTAWPQGLIVPLLPFIAGGLATLTGIGAFWFMGPVLVFVLVPILDHVSGLDKVNPPVELEDQLEGDRFYRYVIYAFIPLQYASLIWACYVWANWDLSTVESLGLALSVAMVSGIAINTAHELGHKHPTVERRLSKIGLAQPCYGHFYIEHNRGHHTRVSTPEDPASSRVGETFWEFLPRTVIGSLRSAIGLERERCARTGRRFWSPKNDLLNAWALSVVLYGGLLAVFGWSIAPWLAIQIVFGFCMLEVVNYIEHYGLLRERKDNGRYERCQPHHSWNASNLASNVLLYQLQRHSDHHAHPTRRYQILRHFDEVPQLPTGYAGMISVAVVPAWWRRVMDHRVLEFYGGDITRANIHPRTRAKVLARYGPGTPAAEAAALAAAGTDVAAA